MLGKQGLNNAETVSRAAANQICQTTYIILILSRDTLNQVEYLGRYLDSLSNVCHFNVCVR
jgi:hypothetical protein